MANPVKVNIPEDTWTLVAGNVKTGLISIKQWQPSRYWQTYRIAGDPAPTGDQSEDTSVETLARDIPIGGSSSIDVYMFSKDVAGAVVVAL